MHYDSERPAATMNHLITKFVIVGISLALAILITVIASQHTKAASQATNYQDGALKDVIVPGPEGNEKSPRDGVRDAIQIQFEEDNWLIVDLSSGSSVNNEIGDEAWIRFIEESVLLPSAASRSNLLTMDRADRIAALDVDFLDVSLGNDYYRNHGLADDDADSAAPGSDIIDVSLGNDYYRNLARADDEVDSKVNPVSSMDW